jgi:hypothetical protein
LKDGATFRADRAFGKLLAKFVGVADVILLGAPGNATGRPPPLRVGLLHIGSIR